VDIEAVNLYHTTLLISFFTHVKPTFSTKKEPTGLVPVGYTLIKNHLSIS